MKQFALLLACLSVLTSSGAWAQATDPEVDGAKWVKSIGVPIYPGAMAAKSKAWEHDGKFAGGNFGWTCNDTVAQVVAFYEKATKSKGKEERDKRTFNYWTKITTPRDDVVAGKRVDIEIVVRENKGDEGPLIEGGGRTMIGIYIEDPYRVTAAQAPQKETPAPLPAQKQSEIALEKAEELRIPLFSEAALEGDASWYRNGELFLMMTSGSSVEKIASFYEKAVGVKRDPHSDATTALILVPKAPANQILQVMVMRDEASSGKSRLVIISHPPMSAPTERELGVPIYKNAVFSVLASTANSYYWTTSDSMESILSFYEQAAGQKRAPGMPADTGVINAPGAMISVNVNRGEVMGPGKLGIMIMPLPGAQVPQQAQQQTQPQAETAAARPAAPAQEPVRPQPAPKVPSLLDVAKAGTADDILAAVRAGANVNEVDASGYTPLICAAMSNPDPAVIKALVAAGAAVDARGPNQATALMLAAKLTRKAVVVQALIDAQANMKLKDAAGKTAFDYATGNSALMFSPQVAALGLGRF
jgi:hypothetical protein